MSDLVERLSQGEHPVVVTVRPQATPKSLKERIDLGYVHVKFTETRGGTELGLSLIKEETDLSKANFETGDGSVVLAGRLKLDYVPVKCTATIDLATMAGRGHLVKIADWRS